jgi:hypothetical protein
MSNPLLDKFGELLITRVRDKAIGDWERIVSGQMRGATAERVKQQLASVDTQMRLVLLSLVPQIVDTTLHHLLWTVEQERSVDIVTKGENGIAHSIRDVSDGLAGELYSEQGWIVRFSNKRKDHVL